MELYSQLTRAGYAMTLSYPISTTARAALLDHKELEEEEEEEAFLPATPYLSQLAASHSTIITAMKNENRS
eukprot:scaffold10933_cov161-Ochromonas_danica.AAC.2